MKTKFTSVWEINHQLIVADTIEKAIAVYKSHYNYSYDDIGYVKQVKPTEGWESCNTAVIEDNEESK